LTARRFGSALPVDDGGLLAECAAIAGVRRKVLLYASDAVSSPVVFGVFRPRIVIPPALTHDREALRFVLLHELAHIRRGDNALRAVSAALLCVHWFNPLVWLMFLLSGRDMELACDAAVLRRIDQPARKQYALVLAALAENRQPVLAVAFGQSAVRQRILGIVRYKRATVATIILSAAFIAALAVVMLTNPVMG
jgi:beta-lactamase regulating signal transducer with metallopeptidase domain